jgi:hypothetical protein
VLPKMPRISYKALSEVSFKGFVGSIRKRLTLTGRRSAQPSHSTKPDPRNPKKPQAWLSSWPNLSHDLPLRTGSTRETGLELLARTHLGSFAFKPWHPVQWKAERGVRKDRETASPVATAHTQTPIATLWWLSYLSPKTSCWRAGVKQ